MHGSTAAVVGAILLRLRKQRGLTRADAAAVLECDISKISRLETGQTDPKVQDVERLLTHYGVLDPVERDYVLGLTSQDILLGWWETESDLPLWVRARFAGEAAAKEIRSYQPLVVPTLLQRGDYVRALSRIVLGPEAPPDHVERRTAVINARRALLEGTDPPVHFWVIIEETALWAPVGSVQAHVRQLDALIKATQQPHICVQVNPAASAYRPATNAFTLLRPRDLDVPQIVYVDGLITDRAVRNGASTEAYLQTFHQLAIVATGADSVDMLTDIRDRVAAGELGPTAVPFITTATP